jgi:hypothetical protein
MMIPIRHHRIWGAGALVAGLLSVWAISSLAQGPAPLYAWSFGLGVGTKTATASSGAATLNQPSGIITTEALTTAAGATYTLVVTNSTVAATDQVYAAVYYGSSTTGRPAITTVTPGSGTVTIIVQNIHASAALNGTLKINFMTLEP